MMAQYIPLAVLASLWWSAHAWQPGAETALEEELHDAMALVQTGAVRLDGHSGNGRTKAACQPVTNGNFESGTLGAIPDGWSRYGSYGTTGLLTDAVAYTGTRSIYFEGAGWQLIHNGPAEEDAWSLVNGVTYSISFWAYTAAGNAGYRLRLELLPYTGFSLSSGHLGRFFTGSANAYFDVVPGVWTQYHYTFHAGETQTNVRMNVGLTEDSPDTGKVYIDDLALDCPTQDWNLVMKLKAGSDLFDWASFYWQDTLTVDEGTHGVSSTVADEADDANTKLPAFMDEPVDRFLLCYGNLHTCYTYHLGTEYSSAYALFTSGFNIGSSNLGGGTLSAADAKRQFTDMFLPPGDADYDNFWNGGSGASCGMHSPGVNMACDSWNKVRIGYCSNTPQQACYTASGTDADSAVGIGLRYQLNGGGNGWLNAGIGAYFTDNEAASTRNQKQAWLFVRAGTESPTMSPTASPTTASPTMSPTMSPTAAANLIGDPHITSVKGDRFDSHITGNVTLLQMPKSTEAAAAPLLKLTGLLQHADPKCRAGTYLTVLHVDGAWMPQRRVFYPAPRRALRKQHIRVGPHGISIAVVHGRTETGVRYLNLRVHNLGRAGLSIGGLLGGEAPEEKLGAPAECA